MRIKVSQNCATNNNFYWQSQNLHAKIFIHDISLFSLFQVNCISKTVCIYREYINSFMKWVNGWNAMGFYSTSKVFMDYIKFMSKYFFSYSSRNRHKYLLSDIGNRWLSYSWKCDKKKVVKEGLQCGWWSMT